MAKKAKVYDFGAAWEAHHPGQPRYDVQRTLNVLAAEEALPSLQHDQARNGIDRVSYLRDLGKRMLQSLIGTKGKPLGKEIMNDFNKLNPDEVDELISLITPAKAKEE